MVKQISNEIYFLIKYIKSVLWREAKRLSYTEDARCLKVKCNDVSEKHTAVVVTVTVMVQVNSYTMRWKTCVIYNKKVSDAIWSITDMRCGREDRIFPEPVAVVNSKNRSYQGLNQ